LKQGSEVSHDDEPITTVDHTIQCAAVAFLAVVIGCCAGVLAERDYRTKPAIEWGRIQREKYLDAQRDEDHLLRLIEEQRVRFVSLEKRLRECGIDPFDRF
jgi:hypothetical protein